jgi:hypothetical protein
MNQLNESFILDEARKQTELLTSIERMLRLFYFWFILMLVLSCLLLIGVGAWLYGFYQAFQQMP